MFMRLSLTKAAHMAMSSAARQEIRVRSGRDDNSFARTLWYSSWEKQQLALKRNCHLDRSVAEWRDLRFYPSSGQNVEYPETRKDDQVDDYHGIKVEDPYRWLEDDNSAETTAWVSAQNRVTFDYLEQIPYRSRLKQRLQELYNYPKYGIPSRSGAYYLWSKNDGLQNQSVLYVQEGLEGTPRVLIDPNQLSPDGTVRLMAGEASQDGRYFAYYLSSGGSDWLEAHVLEIETGSVLTDH